MKIKGLISKSVYFLGCVLVFFLLGEIKVGYQGLNPFAISLIFSFFVLRYRVVGSVFCFLVANILSQFSLYGLYITLNIVGVIFPTYAICKRFKLKISKYFAIIPMMTSCVSYIYFNLGNVKQNMAIMLSLTLMIIFYFVCLNFFNAVLNRSLISFNIDEKICGATFLILIGIDGWIKPTEPKVDSDLSQLSGETRQLSEIVVEGENDSDAVISTASVVGIAVRKNSGSRLAAVLDDTWSVGSRRH